MLTNYIDIGMNTGIYILYSLIGFYETVILLTKTLTLAILIDFFF